ncbi:MAG: CHAP domain-containing protein [Alphaproteobacteria bacterium]|nr:MAG: CHAP domain-containing protein [Alphaproteobacteria bacterium]
MALGVGILMLAGCASTPPAPPPSAPVATPVAAPGSPGRLNPFPVTDRFLYCVPFARHVSGIDIRGDAHTWWGQAAGRFERGNQPRVGSVLAMPATRSMPQGHVAVVVSVLDARRILVSHANWGMDGNTRGVIHERMPVIDVSARNDWSEIRLMNTGGTFGRVYPAQGFIHQSTQTAARR